ncbi:MAG TPA: undecaprenyl-diphosphate phosphatase [Verrucomicrobiae bacterium]
MPSKDAVRDWIDVLILAVIEGITEFLPISSTGHMLLAKEWLSYKPDELFLAVVQSGAVLAVLLVFTARVKQMITQWRERETQDFVGKLIAAFLVTAIGGLVLKKMNFKLEEDPVPVALATLIGGILILWIEMAIRKKVLRDSITWPVAIAIGAGQLLAVIFPGLSRSGTAIMLALALGIARSPATEFSFLLGIPTLLSAGALKIYEAIKEDRTDVNWLLLAWGTFIAAATAFVAVKWLLKFVRSHTFNGFGWYRIVLGIAILVLVYFAR